MNLLNAIIATIIAGLVISISKLIWDNNLKELIISLLTKNNILGIYSYDSALKMMNKNLSKCLYSKSCSVKIMCFMGKDIISENGILKHIKSILENGGTVQFLIMNPNSKYVSSRAKEIGFNVKSLQAGINYTINSINDEIKHKYPNSVIIKMYNHKSIFRINIINDYLFLGFYRNVKSYNNLFIKVNNKSILYSIFESIFGDNWNEGKEI